MTTDEIINRLREYAVCEIMCPSEVRETMNEAADRLEELDDRVAIMSEGNQITMDEVLNE